MLRLVARRLGLAIPLIFVVTFVTFVLVALTPGDPAATILGSYGTPSTDRALDVKLGFDQSVFVQYWHWLSKAIHGDLGMSILSGQPVSEQLTSRLSVTLSLVIGATLVSAVVGVALGTLSARRGGRIGRVTDGMAMLGFAVPSFWLGLVLVDLFALNLRWFPATGYVSFAQSPTRWFESLVLPVITLAAGGVTMVTKQTRDSMREVLAKDFIDALRADGVPEWRIVYVHALRNAAIPVVTLLGTFFVGLLGGAVLIEGVFALPGLGSLAVSASSQHDLPVIQGIALYFCIIVVAVNLIVDVLYGWLNPRARVSS
jgi:peptide/nickel transport system permease protein